MKREMARSGSTAAPLTRRFIPRKSVLAMSGVLMTTLAGINALAQETGEQPATNTIQLEEIVVTGTLIRGIEPTGSQTIAIDKESIIESGAITATDILGTLPQATNLFNARTSLDPRAQSQNTINRPNLRNLPGFSTSTGAATLILVDGHRVTGMGVGLSAVDPDILPPGVIERVEVITDGGSSLYGADAVGGVVNFITRKNFEGVQIDAGYSTGDNHWGYDTNITAGTSWEGGSGYVALSYADRDAILGKDRRWSRGGIWSENGVTPSGTQCREPVGGTNTFTFTDFGFLPFGIWYPAGSTSTGSPCDIGAEGALVPEEDRGSIFFGVSQELTDNISLDVKGYYSERTTTFASYPLGDSLSLGEEPLVSVPGQPGNLGDVIEVLNVGFSYGPHAAYRHRESETSFETWGITPELTIDLDNGWQLRSLLHYSQSDNERWEPGTNRSLLVQAIEDGLVDPFDIASADTAAIQNILNWQTAAESEQSLLLARFIADGTLFSLPAGEVRLAAGVEYQDQTAKLRQGETVRGGLGSLAYPKVDRDVKAAFAELHIPLLSGVRGVEALDLSLSVRHDDYSDFGETTNPHVGLTWKPVDWVSVHANWGESFNAPTLVDTLNGQNSIIYYNAATAGLVAAVAAGQGIDISGRPDVMQVRGANPGLLPQTAETWAVGFEMSPPVFDGLTLSANYYEIDFDDILGFFDPTSVQSARAFIDKYIFNPTQEQLEEFAKLGSNGQEAITGVNPNNLAALIDLRTTNASSATLKGVDFAVNYVQDTSIGTLNFGLSGNHQTKFDLASRAGDVTDQLKYGSPDTLISAYAGIQSGNWRSRLTVKHTVGFDVDDAAMDTSGNVLQDSVSSFTTVDLFVGYDFNGSGFTEDLSLRFNVANLFDKEPPRYRRNDVPPYSGFTMGRIFTLGVTKRFW